MDTDELTPEAFDKLKERVQVLEEMIFVEMKLTADRTDISACAKVDKIKAFIEQLREDGTEEEVEEAEDKKLKVISQQRLPTEWATWTQRWRTT